MRFVNLNSAQTQFLLMLSYGSDVLIDFIEANIIIKGLISVLNPNQCNLKGRIP